MSWVELCPPKKKIIYIPEHAVPKSVTIFGNKVIINVTS